MPPHRIFLLSPAHCGGKRADYVLRDNAAFDIARQIRSPGGAPLGHVFTFLSGLYFRGKLAYANRFARPPAGAAGTLVITSRRGLLPPETPITLDELRDMGTVDIDADDPRYTGPLARDARALAQLLTARDQPYEVVLLGSIATGKYVDVLSDAFGDRLRFPEAFVGRGDMSRGGLMLRCVTAGEELTYVPLAGATRRGKRPPRL